MTTLGDDTTTAILRGLRDLLEHVHRLQPEEAGPTLAHALTAHLGVDATSIAVTREEIDGHRYIDMDIALAEVAGRDPDARIVGVGGGDMRYHASLGASSRTGRSGPGRCRSGRSTTRTWRSARTPSAASSPSACASSPTAVRR